MLGEHIHTHIYKNIFQWNKVLNNPTILGKTCISVSYTYSLDVLILTPDNTRYIIWRGKGVQKSLSIYGVSVIGSLQSTAWLIKKGKMDRVWNLEITDWYHWRLGLKSMSNCLRPRSGLLAKVCGRAVVQDYRTVCLENIIETLMYWCCIWVTMLLLDHHTLTD